MCVCVWVCEVLPAGEVPCGCQTVAGDTDAVTTVVTLVNLTRAAGVLRLTAAQFGATVTLQTCSFVQAVAFTASCSHTDINV